MYISVERVIFLRMSKRDVSISKALSWLLRHGATKEKLDIDEEGYVPLQQVLTHQRLKSFRASREDIERIVENNDKKRFSLATKNGTDVICANQGHTLREVGTSQMKELVGSDIPDEIYHGTYRHKLADIIGSGGLSRMQRNHIHFTNSSTTNVSGIRRSCNILIYIDGHACARAGIRFYVSANGVILSPGDARGQIPMEFWLKVVDLRTSEEFAGPAWGVAAPDSTQQK